MLTRRALADILTIVPVRGYSSAGRALDWQSRGQRFDPAYLHQKETVAERRLFSFFAMVGWKAYTDIKNREKRLFRFSLFFCGVPRIISFDGILQLHDPASFCSRESFQH